MKKLLLVAVFLLTFFITGCDAFGNNNQDNQETEDNLELALTKMNQLDSYQLELVMNDVPIFGTITLVQKFDGDLMSLDNQLVDVQYSKIIEGETYKYILENEVYTLSETPMESSGLTDNAMLLNEINPSDFIETSTGYSLNITRVDLNDEGTEYMSDIIITLTDDGYINQLSFQVHDGDLEISASITFSEYNNVTITVPGV